MGSFEWFDISYQLRLVSHGLKWCQLLSCLAVSAFVAKGQSVGCESLHFVQYNSF